LAEKYENFWKTTKSDSKRLNLSIEDDNKIIFIEDPHQDEGREQTATEGEQ
jgi:hypothetical protein